MTSLDIALIVGVAGVAVVATAFALLRVLAQSGLVSEHDDEVIDDDSTWYEDSSIAELRLAR